MVTALGRMPRLRILERDAISVHAVLPSPWLRIPTDIELQIDVEARLVHVRVARPYVVRERSQSRLVAQEVLRRIEQELRVL